MSWNAISEEREKIGLKVGTYNVFIFSVTWISSALNNKNEKRKKKKEKKKAYTDKLRRLYRRSHIKVSWDRSKKSSFKKKTGGGTSWQSVYLSIHIYH